MFSKTQDDRPSTGRGGQVSVLASDLIITGVIASEGTIELHGNVDGELAAATLVVGHDGRMKGKVQAGQVDVRGELDGAVTCGSLTLRAAARLNADCQSGRLVIESGAEVEGRFSRPAPPPPAASTGTSAPAPSPAPQTDFDAAEGGAASLPEDQA